MCCPKHVETEHKWNIYLLTASGWCFSFKLVSLSGRLTFENSWFLGHIWLYCCQDDSILCSDTSMWSCHCHFEQLAANITYFHISLYCSWKWSHIHQARVPVHICYTPSSVTICKESQGVWVSMGYERSGECSEKLILDFKLSPCFDCSFFSFDAGDLPKRKETTVKN